MAMMDDDTIDDVNNFTDDSTSDDASDDMSSDETLNADNESNPGKKGLMKRLIISIVFILLGVFFIVYGDLFVSNHDIPTIAARKINPDYDKQLVHINIPAKKKTLEDNLFKISSTSISLKRIVEMYQWDASGKKMLWSDTVIADPNLLNPKTALIQSQSFEIENKDKLGIYTLAPPLLKRYQSFLKKEKITLDDSHLSALGENGAKAFKLYDNSFYFGLDAHAPEVGDFRVRFERINGVPVSILAQQNNRTLAPFMHNDKPISQIVVGTHTAESLSENLNIIGSTASLWIIRAIGLVPIFIGLAFLLARSQKPRDFTFNMPSPKFRKKPDEHTATSDDTDIIEENESSEEPNEYELETLEEQSSESIDESEIEMEYSSDSDNDSFSDMPEMISDDLGNPSDDIPQSPVLENEFSTDSSEPNLPSVDIIGEDDADEFTPQPPELTPPPLNPSLKNEADSSDDGNNSHDDDQHITSAPQEFKAQLSTEEDPNAFPSSVEVIGSDSMAQENTASQPNDTHPDADQYSIKPEAFDAPLTPRAETEDETDDTDDDDTSIADIMQDLYDTDNEPNPEPTSPITHSDDIDVLHHPEFDHEYDLENDQHLKSAPPPPPSGLKPYEEKPQELVPKQAEPQAPDLSSSESLDNDRHDTLEDILNSDKPVDSFDHSNDENDESLDSITNSISDFPDEPLPKPETTEEPLPTQENSPPPPPPAPSSSPAFDQEPHVASSFPPPPPPPSPFDGQEESDEDEGSSDQPSFSPPPPPPPSSGT